MLFIHGKILILKLRRNKMKYLLIATLITLAMVAWAGINNWNIQQTLVIITIHMTNLLMLISSKRE